MPNYVLIFPNQLYERWLVKGTGGLMSEVLDNTSSAAVIITLVEEPLYFYDPVMRPYRTSPLKIAFLHAAMTCFFDKLRKAFPHVTYVEYSYTSRWLKDVKADNTADVFCFDPVDKECTDKYRRAFGKRFNQRDAPVPDMFLANRQDLDSFHRPSTRHDAFYKMMKTKLDVLTHVPSQDEDNRKPYTSDIVQGFIKSEQRNLASEGATKRYIAASVQYVLKHPVFKSHVYPQHKSMVRLYQISIDHSSARQHLTRFIRERLASFGPYQDAFHSDVNLGSHADISILLNCGLLTPQQVLDAVLAVRQKIPLNSFEGFIRQLIGWREYMHYIYTYHYNTELLQANLTGNSRRITYEGSPWYGGKQTLGIPALDVEIGKAMETGYAHHIVRLMVFLNAMSLCDVHPHDIVRWFMEVVALDAYPWVMWSNVIAMGGFSSKFMRKPYLSTSNYIQKMSNYGRSNIWDALFYDRLVEKSKIIGGPYQRNLGYFRKLSKAEQNKMTQLAQQFRRKMTRPYKSS